jgi:hypothetical protein
MKIFVINTKKVILYTSLALFIGTVSVFTWAFATVTPLDKCMIQEELHSGQWKLTTFSNYSNKICLAQMITGRHLYKGYYDALPQHETPEIFFERMALDHVISEYTSEKLEELVAYQEAHKK